jgi:hypothetical protein
MNKKKPGCLQLGIGCFGMMGIAMLCLLMFASQMPSVQVGDNGTANSATQKSSFLTKIGERFDGTGSTIVFALNDEEWSIERLRELCSKEKSARAGEFRNVVVFDRSENAAFPVNVTSGGYVDESHFKHIIAVYNYNGDSFSELVIYYPKNMWTGKASREKL